MSQKYIKIEFPEIKLNGKKVEIDIITKINIEKKIHHMDVVNIECYGDVELETIDTNTIYLTILDPVNGKKIGKFRILDQVFYKIV